jgi:hypothetical protein
VLFAVGDTYARRDFSPAEGGELGSFAGSLVVHDALHPVESAWTGAVMAK